MACLPRAPRDTPAAWTYRAASSHCVPRARAPAHGAFLRLPVPVYSKTSQSFSCHAFSDFLCSITTQLLHLSSWVATLGISNIVKAPIVGRYQTSWMNL